MGTGRGNEPVENRRKMDNWGLTAKHNGHVGHPVSINPSFMMIFDEIKLQL